jgi:hypothetical protein
MFQGITSIARRGGKLLVDHGYQPFKSQMDAEDLTLSIVSIFGERCPGDPEPEPF